MPPHQCAAATATGHQCTRNVWGADTLCGIHRGHANTRIFAALPAPEHPRCLNCTHNALPGMQFCRRHERLRPRPDLPPEQRCTHDGCMRIVDEHQRCRVHVIGFIRMRRLELWNEMYIPGMLQIAERPEVWREVVATWAARIGEPFIDARFLQTLEMTVAREMRIPELWNRHMGDHAPMDAFGQIAWLIMVNDDELPLPRAPPRTELEGFSRDTQNIHTRVVTQQTNAAMDILLNADVPSDQNTLAETIWCFRTLVTNDHIKTSLTEMTQVDRDMKRWYRTETCRMEGDFLYKRTLDGLWAKIKTSSLRHELEIRLWQEMVDSLGMCSDGHISRLTNVLCGFDDAFAPELSPAEKLQNRMAVIAEMEGGIILQVATAVAAFKELNIPEEQWEAWIDAL